jgi:hypothetical protein
MSSPLTNPASHIETSGEAKARVRPIRTPLPDDGTRQLLQGALWTLLTGVLAALAMRFLFGGIGTHGPHTNAGWIALIVAMMCLPFGCMLLLLGGAKYLRNRRLARKGH